MDKISITIPYSVSTSAGVWEWRISTGKKQEMWQKCIGDCLTNILD